MLEETFSTKQVGKILDCPSSRISRMVWNGNCHEPEKDSVGRFRWLRYDIERASWDLGRQRNFAAWSAANPELKQPKQPEAVVRHSVLA